MIANCLGSVSDGLVCLDDAVTRDSSDTVGVVGASSARYFSRSRAIDQIQHTKMLADNGVIWSLVILKNVYTECYEI